MKIFAVANLEQQQEILAKPATQEVEWTFCKEYSEAAAGDPNSPLFLLSDDAVESARPSLAGRPVFINSVITTLKEGNYSPSFIRINAWPGFLSRPIWELATADQTGALKIMNVLGWEGVLVGDEPGLVAARVISMVINEAYFALQEGVSGKKEIDMAMKLGNNYPFGPMEWLGRIGIEKVYTLLNTLSKKDARYAPAPLLFAEFQQQTSSSHDSPH